MALVFEKNLKTLFNSTLELVNIYFHLIQYSQKHLLKYLYTNLPSNLHFSLKNRIPFQICLNLKRAK